MPQPVTTIGAPAAGRLPDRARQRARPAPCGSASRSTIRRARAGSAAIISVMWYGGPSRGDGCGVDAHGSGRARGARSGRRRRVGHRPSLGARAAAANRPRPASRDAGPASGRTIRRLTKEAGSAGRRLLIPQGWKGEYDGWDPADAWARTVELARQAEELGFESLWVFDHFHDGPRADRRDHVRVVLGARRRWRWSTERVRLGHMVVCTGFRNPALTAKLSSTIDVISGGRFELGIGAGWKEDEWLAYGYGFPTIGERLAALGDHLEVISRMLGPGRATYEGEYAHVRGAINEPKGLQQPRIPIIVGGNGPNVTCGYAVRFADELNLVFLAPDEIAELMATAAPALRGDRPRPGHAALLAVHRDEEVGEPGQRRVDLLGRLAEIGLDRLVAFPTRWRDARGPGRLRRGLPGGGPSRRGAVGGRRGRLRVAFAPARARTAPSTRFADTNPCGATSRIEAAAADRRDPSCSMGRLRAAGGRPVLVITTPVGI